MGDYTEWLVASALDLDLEKNSRSGYDALSKDKNSIKFQIKGRRLTPENKSWMLGAIRNYQENYFDQLSAVIFDENFNILEAWLIQHEVIVKYAAYRKHANAHILVLLGKILSDPEVKSIKYVISNYHILRSDCLRLASGFLLLAYPFVHINLTALALLIQYLTTSHQLFCADICAFSFRESRNQLAVDWLGFPSFTVLVPTAPLTIVRVSGSPSD